MNKFLILLFMVLPITNIFAVQLDEKVSCYLSKIDQEYPHDAIPAVGVIEFSIRKIKVPVQFFGNVSTIWESPLKVATNGTFAGDHFWNIQIFRSENGKIDRIFFEFENPDNLGLPNEESTYSAEAYCSDFDGKQTLSEGTARNLIKEYSQRQFPIISIEFKSLKIIPEDGCNRVLAFSNNTKVCSQSQEYAGTVVSIKVCDDQIVQSGFYCDDY